MTETQRPADNTDRKTPAARAAELVNERLSAKAIAERMNAENYRTTRGVLWTAPTVFVLLRQLGLSLGKPRTAPRRKRKVRSHRPPARHLPPEQLERSTIPEGLGEAIWRAIESAECALHLDAILAAACPGTARTEATRVAARAFLDTDDRVVEEAYGMWACRARVNEATRTLPSLILAVLEAAATSLPGTVLLDRVRDQARPFRPQSVTVAAAIQADERVHRSADGLFRLAGASEAGRENSVDLDAPNRVR